MNDIQRFFSGTVSDGEATIINSTGGVVIKTILIANNGTEKAVLSLKIDSENTFKFDVEGETSRIINVPIVCNILKATATANVNLHISGMNLG